MMPRSPHWFRAVVAAFAFATVYVGFKTVHAPELIALTWGGIAIVLAFVVFGND